MKTLEGKVIPKNRALRGLYRRYSRRMSAFCFSIYSFFHYLVIVIFGIVFCLAAYDNRNYALSKLGPDSFFKNKIKNLNILKLPIINTYIGTILVLIGAFCLINNLVILFHLIKGGNKKRLLFINYIGFVIQIFLFLGAIIILVFYDFSMLLVHSFFIFIVFNLLSSIIYFILVKRSVDVTITKDGDYPFLSMRIMKNHKILLE